MQEAEESVYNMEESLKSKVLLAQLNFYRVILGVECDKKPFCKPKVEETKRRNLSWEELYENLIIVIQANLIPKKQSLCNLSNNLKPRILRDAAVESKKKRINGKNSGCKIKKINRATEKTFLIQIY